MILFVLLLCAAGGMTVIWFATSQSLISPRRLSAAAVGVASVCAALAVLHTVAQPDSWPGHAQIAWTAVASDGEQPLYLGFNPDDPDQGAAGWPNFRTAPAIAFQPVGQGSVSLRIRNGGGFVLDSNEKVLYGLSLDAPAVVQSRKGRTYTLAIRKSPLWLLTHRWNISVLEDSRELLSNGECYITSADTAVISLSGALNPAIRRLRYSQDAASGPLTRWADEIQILLLKGHAYYVSSAPAFPEADPVIPVDSTITIRWPRERLTARVEVQGQAAGLVFQPPFRRSTPFLPRARPEFHTPADRIESRTGR